MNKRNMIWLAIVVVVGVVVIVAVSFWWGVLAAAVTLAISEAVERTLRKRRRAARGETAPVSVKDAITSRRKPR